MNRMALIAVALCAVLITTVGAGAVTAKQQANPRQAGASSIYFFDVAATGTHGAGKLIINLAEHKFIFNGKGFDPAKTYYLQYRTGNIPGINTFASTTAAPSGNIHIEGTWLRDIATLPAAPAFSVGNISPLYAKLHWGSYPMVYINGHPYAPLAFNAEGSLGPIVRYELTLVVGGQYDYYVVYNGPNVNLNDHGAPNSDKINVDQMAPYAYAELYVYDSNGNSAWDLHDLDREIPS